MTNPGEAEGRDLEAALADYRAGRAVGSTGLEVVLRALEVLGDQEKALRWLSYPNGALGGVTPRSLLGTEAGVQQVSAVLVRIGHGVFE